jgi:hypothetical protein
MFLDMIVTPGDLSPEGLAAFHFRGDFYLAIANEVPASGATPRMRRETGTRARLHGAIRPSLIACCTSSAFVFTRSSAMMRYL